MRPSEALASKRDQILLVLSRYNVTNPCVFGSVARGEDTRKAISTCLWKKVDC